MRNPSLVFIADVVKAHEDTTLESRDLECITESYYHDVMDALSTLSMPVKHYSSPEEFIDNIQTHKNDIVFSLWSGISNRNRKALVPAICEAYHISYVGADPYVHFMCQDKSLAKTIARNYGFESAKEVLIKSESEIRYVSDLCFPVIVKPNLEGGSIGISSDSVIDSPKGYEEHISRLLSGYQQPILVEEYIGGDEICITIAGSKRRIDVLDAVQINIRDSGAKYTVYGYEAKKDGIIDTGRTHYNPLPRDLREKCCKLFCGLGKVDIMRIDGKVVDGKFYLIELSPDASMSKGSSAAQCFHYAGFTYPEMFETVISYQL